MRKITTISFPAALALFVVTAHPEGATKKSSPDQSDTIRSQQTELNQEQKNHQSTFDPQRVSDSELKKNVSEVNKASTFMGMSIQNLQNEKLGTVKDLVFDPESGKISYAVLSVGGFLGVRDKLIAVPLNSLRPQPGQKYLVLNMTKDELTRAPGLAKNNWPRLDDPALGSPAPSEHSSSSSTPRSSNSSDKNSSSSNKSSDSGSSPSSDFGKSSDQLSAPQNSPASSTTKDAQGSNPSSEEATTSNSGKDSGASPSTVVGDSDKAKKSDSKKS
jgi:sporulation protein YlmC with PRC-barrel domain